MEEEAENTAAVETNEAAQAPTEGAGEAPDADQGGAAQEVQPAGGDAPSDNPTGGEEVSDTTSQHFFNGEQVEVSVDDGIRESLDSAGFNTDALVGELYREGGDFTLSEETRASLCEKFPAAMVDSFLGMLKAQNESHLRQRTQDQESQEAQAKQAESWAYEQVGGEQNWGAMQSWLEGDTSVTDEQIASFNAAMDSGNSYIQELAIKDLYARYRKANGDADSMQLVQGDGAADTTGGALTMEAYHKEMLGISKLPLRERKDAQAKLDLRRREGQKLGI